MSTETIDKPEWVRVNRAVELFGLCRSDLYLLIKNNTIKTRVVKKRGAIQGVRLISYDSLNAYIEDQPEGTNPKPANV